MYVYIYLDIHLHICIIDIPITSPLHPHLIPTTSPFKSPFITHRVRNFEPSAFRCSSESPRFAYTTSLVWVIDLPKDAMVIDLHRMICMIWFICNIYIYIIIYTYMLYIYIYIYYICLYIYIFCICVSGIVHEWFGFLVLLIRLDTFRQSDKRSAEKWVVIANSLPASHLTRTGIS